MANKGKWGRRSKKPPPKRKRPVKSRYRSGFEQRTAELFESLGVPYGYEDTVFPYTKQHTYTPDFSLLKKDGTYMYIETKGWFSPEDRAKSILVRRDHPGIDLRFIFLKAGNTLGGKSTTTYWEWCNKHDFLWADSELPDEWLEELK